MDVTSAIRERRSIRKFTNDRVSDEDITKILEAGRWAPSGLNNQPWKFLVLRGQIKDELERFTKYGKIIRDCDTCICVFLDENSCYNRTKDIQAIGACLQNMLLQAHGMGLGAVWLGEILNKGGEVIDFLGIEHELMAVIAIGMPYKELKSGERKELGDFLIKVENK